MSILFISGCSSKKLPIDKNELVKLSIDDVADIEYLLKFKKDGYLKYTPKLYRTPDGLEEIKKFTLVTSDLKKYCEANDGKYLYYKDTIDDTKISNIAHTKGLPSNRLCFSHTSTNYDYACVKNNKALFLVNTYYKEIKNPISETGYYDNEWAKFIAGTPEYEANVNRLITQCTDNYKKEEQARQTKIEQDKAKQDTITQLRKRIGTYEMTIYDKFTFDGLYKTAESECRDMCNNLNLQNTGYISLNEALNNGWEPTGAVLGDDKIIPNKYRGCTCVGKKLILKRTKIPKNSYYER